jgi:hypothetical protein
MSLLPRRIETFEEFEHFAKRLIAFLWLFALVTVTVSEGLTNERFTLWSQQYLAFLLVSAVLLLFSYYVWIPAARGIWMAGRGSPMQVPTGSPLRLDERLTWSRPIRRVTVLLRAIAVLVLLWSIIGMPGLTWLRSVLSAPGVSR